MLLMPSCDGGTRTHEAKKRDLMRVLRYQLRSHRNFKKCWDAPIILSTEFLEVAFIVIQHLKKVEICAVGSLSLKVPSYKLNPYWNNMYFLTDMECCSSSISTLNLQETKI